MWFFEALFNAAPWAFLFLRKAPREEVPVAPVQHDVISSLQNPIRPVRIINNDGRLTRIVIRGNIHHTMQKKHQAIADLFEPAGAGNNDEGVFDGEMVDEVNGGGSKAGVNAVLSTNNDTDKDSKDVLSSNGVDQSIDLSPQQTPNWVFNAFIVLLSRMIRFVDTTMTSNILGFLLFALLSLAISVKTFLHRGSAPISFWFPWSQIGLIYGLALLRQILFIYWILTLLFCHWFGVSSVPGYGCTFWVDLVFGVGYEVANAPASGKGTPNTQSYPQPGGENAALEAVSLESSVAEIPSSVVPPTLSYRSEFTPLGFSTSSIPSFGEEVDSFRQYTDSSDPSHHLRVLVVDDNFICRSLEIASLQQLDCIVVGASDAADALKIVESDRIGFDVIFIDFQMPVTTGPELAKKLLMKLPEPFLVGLTATVESNVLQTFHEAGVDMVFEKPLKEKTRNRVLRLAKGLRILAT